MNQTNVNQTAPTATGGRTRLVIGNWKMHGSSDSVIALIAALKASIDKNTRVNVGVCAPAVYLWQCREQLVYSSICYGGQAAE